MKFLFQVSLVALSYSMVLPVVSLFEAYRFSYVINANEVISQHTEEASNDVVSGYYSFLQPDGLIRFVRYRAEDEKGFRVRIVYKKLNNEGPKSLLKYPRDFNHPVKFFNPIGQIV